MSNLYQYQFDSPLGEIVALATSSALLLLSFSDEKKINSQILKISKFHQSNILKEENPIIEQAKIELSAYFKGNLKRFDVELLPIGTNFQMQIWRELRRIPYGDIISYKEQAIRLHSPSSVRAVANANSRNNISIIIPCHRVIGTNGKLTGYAGGLWRKQWLLDLEKDHK